MSVRTRWIYFASDWLRVARVFIDRVKLTQVSTRDLILLGSFPLAIVSGQCLTCSELVCIQRWKTVHTTVNVMGCGRLTSNFTCRHIPFTLNPIMNVFTTG